jgi:hypothetical protein
MGKVNAWAVVLIGCCVLGFDRAQAQDTEDAPSCWWEYASCARQSFGDANWRSVCYADFSGCLGKMQLPACPATSTAVDCSSYKAECYALAVGDVELMADCTDDADACALAHGC